MPDQHRTWIGVDLDGTLAEYHGFQGETVIGKPIPAMVLRVRVWLAMGLDVRIFTARAYQAAPETIKAIEDWCAQHIGRVLPVTCIKDHGMIALYDDRAHRVGRNTGLIA